MPMAEPRRIVGPLRVVVPICVVVVTLGLLGLVSCGDDGGDHVVAPSFKQDDESVDTSLGNVSGTASIEGSSPANVRVTVGDMVGSPDATGRFFLPGLDPAQTVAWFRYNPQQSTFTCRHLDLVAGGETHLPGVRLLRTDRYGVVLRNAVGGTVTIAAQRGSSATFPDSSLVRDGVVFTGSCAPYVAAITADDPQFAAAFPGSFRGIRRDDTEVPLDAVGVFWVSVVGSGAATLDLAPGAAVTYRLGVDVDGPVPPPANVVVWTLDLATGDWREAGAADLIDGAYTVDVAALGPICWANPATTSCEVSGSVQDGAGQPLANVTVDYRDQSGRTRSSALTGDDGAFVLSVRPSTAAVVTPYFGSIVGGALTIDTASSCPYVFDAPLVVTLPSYGIDLTWLAAHVDLDGYLLVLVPDLNGVLRRQWTLNYTNPGSENAAPFAWLAHDVREGNGPESFRGRRWYDGQVQYWVRDYTHRDTAALRATGARVDLAVGGQTWSFAVADTPFEPDVSDSTGWWHVFDIQIAGSEVTVVPADRFEPSPPAR